MDSKNQKVKRSFFEMRSEVMIFGAILAVFRRLQEVLQNMWAELLASSVSFWYNNV